jgi:hypothetical protein
MKHIHDTDIGLRKQTNWIECNHMTRVGHQTHFWPEVLVVQRNPCKKSYLLMPTRRLGLWALKVSTREPKCIIIVAYSKFGLIRCFFNFWMYLLKCMLLSMVMLLVFSLTLHWNTKSPFLFLICYCILYSITDNYSS